MTRAQCANGEVNCFEASSLITKELMALNLAIVFLLTSFSLAEDSKTLLEPIVVLGSDLEKTSTPLVSAPGSFVETDGTTLRGRAPRSLQTALGVEPNVSFNGSPRPNTEQPQIRGLNAKRILILDEGVRQNFQAEHGGRVFADYSLMERVEVVKGPWSSLYGSGAMGGVVNLRKSNASDLARRTGKDKGVELALDGASNSGEFSQRVTAFAKAKDVEPLISFRNSNANDLKFGDGRTLPYSAYRTRDFYASYAFPISEKTNIELKINRFERKAREPLNPEGFETAIGQLGDLRSHKQDIVGTFRREEEKLSLHAKPYFRETLTKKTRVSDGRADSQRVQTLGIDSWGNRRWQISDDWKSIITVGGEFFQDKNRGRRGMAALANFPDGRTESFGFYTQPQLVYKNIFKITPGLRHDRYRAKSSVGGLNRGNNTSAKLYLSYEFHPANLVFVGWGQAFNAPRLQDLYISGLHFPSFTPGIPNNFFRANPTLRAEKANTAEVGYKGNLSLKEDLLLSPSSTFFLTEATDFINRDVNQKAGTTQLVNLDRARLLGAELSAALRTSTWSSTVAYGQVRGKNTNSSEPLNDTPADHWMNQWETYWGALTIGTEFTYTENQDRVPASTDRTAAYFLQNSYFNYSSSKWSAGLRINNLYNRAYRQHASLNPNPGRDIRVSASYVF